jgi:hypothetical protein
MFPERMAEANCEERVDFFTIEGFKRHNGSASSKQSASCKLRDVAESLPDNYVGDRCKQ